MWQTDLMRNLPAQRGREHGVGSYLVLAELTLRSQLLLDLRDDLGSEAVRDPALTEELAQCVAQGGEALPRNEIADDLRGEERYKRAAHEEARDQMI